MKTFFILPLLIISSPAYGATQIQSIVEEISQQDVTIPQCFAKYVKDRLRYKNVVLYEEYGNDQEDMNRIMAYVAKYLMKTGMHNVLRRTCQQSRICTLSTKPQYLIHANSAEQLELLINRCLCNEFNYQTQFIIIAPSTANFEVMLQILERHISMKNAVIVTSSKDNIELYFGHPRCPTEIESDERKEPAKREVYSCFSITEILPKSSQVSRRREGDGSLQCRMRFGIRTAPPFAFTIPKRANSTENRMTLYGVEVAVVGVLLNLAGSALQNVSTLTGSLGHYNVTTQDGSGLVKHLYDRKIDLIMGALTFYENDFGVEMSYPLFYTVQQAIVMKQKNSNIFYVLGIFKRNVWVTVVCVQIFLIFVSYLLRNQDRENNSPRSSSMFTIVLYFFAILFGKDVPMKQNNLKFVFLSWILVSFFLRTSMEAMLRNILASRDKYNQIDDLAEICNDGYKIFVSEINYSNFKNGFSVSDCFIPPENFLLVNNPLQNLTSADSHEFAAFMYKDVYDFEKWGFTSDINENDLPFHVLKERINNVPLVYFFNRGDILGRKFRNKGMHMYQGGLVLYYQRFAEYFMTLHNIHSLKSEIRMGISVGQVEAVFYLHICGCLLAFVAFVGEIVYHKLQQWS